MLDPCAQKTRQHSISTASEASPGNGCGSAAFSEQLRRHRWQRCQPAVTTPAAVAGSCVKWTPPLFQTDAAAPSRCFDSLPLPPFLAPSLHVPFFVPSNTPHYLPSQFLHLPARPGPPRPAPPPRCGEVHKDEPHHCGAQGLPPLHQEVCQVRLPGMNGCSRPVARQGYWISGRSLQGLPPLPQEVCTGEAVQHEEAE